MAIPILSTNLRDVEEVGFKLRKSDREETVVGYNVATQTLFVDRRKSGEIGFHDAFPCRLGAQLELRNGRLKLHMFVD
jgi:fructan beta-fructosidase